VFSGGACIVNRVHSNGDKPPPPFLDLEVCYNDLSSHPGYIRIGSKQELRTDCPQTAPGQLNILIFMRYDNLPVKATLVICADQHVPQGWQDISGGYHDSHGCDAVAHPDPAFANVRKIYRAQ
jgi:hypothetical protein